MHQIALQSIQISNIFRGNMLPDPPTKLRDTPFDFKSHCKNSFGWKLVTKNVITKNAGSTPALGSFPV